MNNFEKRMLDAGLALTATQTGSIKISSLCQKKDIAEESDKKWFADTGGKRKAYIRRAFLQEFDSVESIGEQLKAPALWVLVELVSINRIKRTPIYRGPFPFNEAPESDAEAYHILEGCNALRGFDRLAVEKYLGECETQAAGLPYGA